MRAAIRAAGMVVAVALAVAGCGGGAATTGTGGQAAGGGGHGAAGAAGGAGTKGSGGTKGTAGATGAGGSAGTTGAGGASGAAGGRSDGGLVDAADASGDGAGSDAKAGLPACALPTRPSDPTGDMSATSGKCNTLPLTGAPVSPGPLAAVDGGARVDGGQLDKPVGGTILAGDYEFVGWLDNGLGGTSRRELRVFDGGTYIEWAATVPGVGSGGADQTVKYDTTAKVAGHTLTILSYTCGDDILDQSYDYSAVGDELTLFNSNNGGGTGNALVAVDTFRRTCTRP